MNFPAIIFTLVTSYFLFAAPRNWAALPLLFGATYMTLGQSVEIGPFHFTVIRILVAVGILRVLSRGETLTGGWQKQDKLMVLWAIWAVASSLFHKDIGGYMVSQLGLAYNALGLYFLLRVFIQDLQSLWPMCKMIIILLVPIALEMISESLTGANRFSIFGGVTEMCEVRAGKIRAQGPFAISILAGTVGAVSLPLALVFWKRNWKLAVAGSITCVCVILSSRSSGPILTAFFAILGLGLWRFRAYMRTIRRSVLVGAFVLNLLMQAPIYYLLARIDLTGSSTGWHRAALLDAAIEHFGEWWLAGTDYTRHWMPYGVLWSEDHADITNHYLKMGVLSGIPLMILFIWIMAHGFASIGRALTKHASESSENQFLIWTLGAVLFGHAATMMSISYFDQTVFFYYFVLAAIASVSAISRYEEVPAAQASFATDVKPETVINTGAAFGQH